MRKILAFTAALSLAFTVGGAPSFAQKLDDNGRCHDKSGKFAKAEVCKGLAVPAGAKATPGAATDLNAPYKLDAKGKCRDAKGRIASKGKCEAPAPTSTPAPAATSKPAPAPDPNAPYKLDAKGKCHDAKGKMVAKGKCKA